MSAKNRAIVVLTLLLAVFIDAAGSALIIPLMTPLFMDTSGIGLMDASASMGQRNFMFGLCLGIFSLCMFLSAPILGELSDKQGRKKLLLLGVAGTFAGHLLCGVAILFHSVWLFLFGRILGGFTSGSLSIAQAAIMDVSAEADKARNIGRVLFSVSIGFFMGPLLGGWLSDNHLVSWFTLATPLFFTAALALGTLLVMAYFFIETFTPAATSTGPINLLSPLTSMLSAFRPGPLQMIIIGYFLMQFGWNTHFQFVALYLAKQFNLNPGQVGNFMALMGGALGLSFGFAVGIFSKRMSVGNMTMFALFLMTAGIFGTLVIPSRYAPWILAVPASVGLAVGFSGYISMLSSQVDPQQQGWIMGVANALSAFASGASGVLAGLVVNFSVSAPLWFALLCLVGSATVLSANSKTENALAPAHSA
jgi:DHA1 family tetracycline resistance protein-like MFS transporter